MKEGSVRLAKSNKQKDSEHRRKDRKNKTEAVVQTGWHPKSVHQKGTDVQLAVFSIHQS